MVKHFDHLTIVVRDTDRTKAFFAVLGFTEACPLRPPAGGQSQRRAHAARAACLGACLGERRRTRANDSARAAPGPDLRLANGVSLIGKFDGEFAGHSSTYAGTGTVRYAW